MAWLAAVFVLAAFAIYSAGSITHGFVAYYAAAGLLIDGQLGSAAYDDRWFGEYLQQLTGSNIRESFTPNPPTMALLAWPIQPGILRRLRRAGTQRSSFPTCCSVRRC